jgi:ADP-ribose pyrophosphatase
VTGRERERYDALRRRWPELFVNPPGAAYEILFEPSLVRAAEDEDEARLAEGGFPADWARTGVVYEDPYIILVRDAIRRPDESLGGYGRKLPASGGAGAVVLPVFEDKIVLIRQFRHATRTQHLEVPRGFGEPGVSAADQARVELREEIQAEADSLVELGSFHSNTGDSSGSTELFLAVIHGFGQPQESEGIVDILLETPKRVSELIRDGKITDSFTIGAFTRAWLCGLLPGWPCPKDLRS